jgi:SAM-dependent methyltransferase
MRGVLETVVPQAESLPGSAESIPLDDGSVDGVFAGQAFHWFAHDDAVREIARVLRPGGRMGVTDIVAEDRLTAAERAERGSYAGCIAGALSFTEFRDGLEAAGLTDVSLTPTHEVADGLVSAIVRATKPADARPSIDLAARPDLPADATGCCGGTGCCG